jgi:hypothetical protein
MMPGEYSCPCRWYRVFLGVSLVIAHHRLFLTIRRHLAGLIADDDAFAGRNHWPHSAPLLLAGGGLQMGQVIGRTTKDGGRPSTEPMTIERLHATILHSLLDVGQMRVAQSHLQDVIRIATAAEPISGLTTWPELVRRQHESGQGRKTPITPSISSGLPASRRQGRHEFAKVVFSNQDTHREEAKTKHRTAGLAGDGPLNPSFHHSVRARR